MSHVHTILNVNPSLNIVDWRIYLTVECLMSILMWFLSLKITTSVYFTLRQIRNVSLYHLHCFAPAKIKNLNGNMITFYRFFFSILPKVRIKFGLCTENWTKFVYSTLVCLNKIYVFLVEGIIMSLKTFHSSEPLTLVI